MPTVTTVTITESGSKGTTTTTNEADRADGRNPTFAKAMLVVDSEADKQGLLAALPEVLVIVNNSAKDSTGEVVSKIEEVHKANGGTPVMDLAFANHAGEGWQLASDCICHPGQEGASRVPLSSSATMAFTAICETKKEMAIANEQLSTSEAEKDIVEAEIRAYIESRRAERERCHRQFEAARQHMIELEQLLAAQIQAPLADGTDVTEWLPDTLLDTILLFSSIRDMNRAGRVSKRWKRLVDSPRCQNFHRTLDVRMAKHAGGGIGHDVMRGHRDAVWSIVFDRTMQRLCSGSRDFTIRAWEEDPTSPRSLVGQQLGQHAQAIKAIALSPDNRRLYTASEDATIKVWDCETGAHVQTCTGHTEWVGAIAISPDGATLYSGSNDHSIRVWNTADFECTNVFMGHNNVITTLALSPDGTTLWSGSWGNDVWGWDVKTGEHCETLEGHYSSILCLAMSANGQLLCSGSADNRIIVWDPVGCALVHSLEGHAGSLRALALSGDGARLYSGSNDKTIRSWDTKSGTQIECLKIHAGSVCSLVLSPDDKRLYSGSYDKTIRVW